MVEKKKENPMKMNTKKIQIVITINLDMHEGKKYIDVKHGNQTKSGKREN